MTHKRLGILSLSIFLISAPIAIWGEYINNDFGGWQGICIVGTVWGFLGSVLLFIPENN